MNGCSLNMAHFRNFASNNVVTSFGGAGMAEFGKGRDNPALMVIIFIPDDPIV